MIVFLGLTAIICSCGLSKTNDKPDQRFYTVIDSARIFNESGADSIASVINALEKDVGSQIVVLTISTLSGKDINAYSYQVANAMGIGRATHDDGILITISVNDRKARIEVGTGLENIIKDEMAAAIIRDQMAPHFRNDEYVKGVYKSTMRIANLIRENKELVGSTPTWKK